MTTDELLKAIVGAGTVSAALTAVERFVTANPSATCSRELRDAGLRWSAERAEAVQP